MRYLAFIAAVAAGVVAPAVAQTGPEARVAIPGEGYGTLTFYERTDFRGQAVTYRDTQRRVNLPFYPRSIRAEGRWTLCPENNGRGECVVAARAYRTAEDLNLRFNVRSVEPYRGNPGNPGGGYPPPGEVAGGQSLTGAASQYFPEPRYGSQRVLACPSGTAAGVNANCAQQTADRLCQTANWRRAAHVLTQVEGRRTYLSDVLCVRR